MKNDKKGTAICLLAYNNSGLKPLSIFFLLLLHFLVVKPTLNLCLIVVVVASYCCSSDKIKMVAGGRDAGCAECIGLEGLPRNGRS